MRLLATLPVLLAALGGCAVTSERSSLGYGDYAALSCEQLAQEAVRLFGDISDRSEHLMQDDQVRRESARRQLNLVKQASADKRCNS